jgi:hypothetical protein
LAPKYFAQATVFMHAQLGKIIGFVLFKFHKPKKNMKYILGFPNTRATDRQFIMIGNAH